MTARATGSANSVSASALPDSSGPPGGGTGRWRASRGHGWIVAGVVYSAVYAAIGWRLRPAPDVLIGFRTIALLLPPLAGVAVIVRRRSLWSGCQWLFWATIALGLSISAIGFIGWTADEILVARETSWLYSYVVMSVDVVGHSFRESLLSLVFLSELQQLLVVAGLAAAAVAARRGRWHRTYVRLAVGALVGFVMLTLSNHGIWQGEYRSVFVYDFTWLLPFFFFPWAAQASPASGYEPDVAGFDKVTPSRPWIIFAVLALLPVVDAGLRALFPVESTIARYRDLSMAVTVVSVLPLLMARLAVERSEMRNADNKARLFAGAVEQAEDLIWVFSVDGGIEYANRAFCRALGYNPTEIASKRVQDLTLERGQLDLEALGAAAEDGGAWRCTLTRRRKDGSTFVSASVVVPLFDRGRLTHFAAVERDVTEDARLCEQLVESERRYRALFDEAPLGIFRASADGRVVDANRAFARLIGAEDPEDLVGTPLMALGADPNEVELTLVRWRESGLPESAELRWLRADGRSILVRLYGQWMPQRDGCTVLEVFAEDVTRQRLLEEEFRQAQKMEAVGRLAGGVAHDFNNQLTVILGYSESLASQIDEDKPIWDDLSEIRRAALNAAALTRRLLAFSRRQLLTLDVHDLNER